ncbi:Heavy metal transport/detoxification superfamily protein [Thalictrum thalictroides]|uniref:Heavy metal transport/detoxification superfamily protein n=1 Tax=Thalictrum thalictroides TaxID=46969 RepID=A0A7J6V2D1_THATH|nr:Heavy metal transport/detoxification superfamily protein [Thalictrum thalictroides]
MEKVVELKVGMHCDQCIKKIMKAIKKIDDIETYDLNIEQNKITVTGNVTSEEVIKALQKIGKTASTWDESSNSGEGKQ